MRAGLRTATLVAVVLVGAPRSQAEPVLGVPGRVIPNQLFVALTVSPAKTTVGKAVQARASVTNGGSRPLLNASLTVRFDPTGLVVAGSPTVTIGTLASLRTVKASWSLCPQQPGNYVIFASARATRVDGVALAVESPAVLLSVGAGRARC